MAIVKTITNDYEFAEWIKRSDSYSNNFTFEGANALQNYLEEYSEETEEDIEFDPIAWCVEWSEYESIEDYNSQHGTEYTYNETPETPEEDEHNIFYQTTCIKLDGDGFIAMDF